MKKILTILSIALLGAVSCNIHPMDEPTNPDGTVTLMMKVTFPEVLISTRAAAGYDPIIENIYVATFGTEHYLNDYVKAVPCNSDGTVKADGYANLKNDTNFYFKVNLAATQTKRYVHIIANGPPTLDYNTYEDDIMKQLCTDANANGTIQGAYWTYTVFPHGTAELDANGQFQPLQEAEDSLSGLKLIRNFARVSLDVAASVTNFTLTGYKVFNTPEHGSVAVWNTQSVGVVDDENSGYDKYYWKLPFDTLWENYDPFMPVGNTSINTTSPVETDRFTDKNDKFIFERPDRSSDRPYIMIQGRFTGDANDTFYRLDFVDRDGNYLPIFRNYEYKITLTSIAKSGSPTPVNVRPSNANVSSLEETQNLTDLADGTSRIYVEWLDQAYMGAGEQTFRYLYLPDATTTTSQQATLKIVSGAGSAIANNTYEGSTPEATSFTQTGPDPNGWYTVHFKTTAAPTSGEKTTVFTVTGENDDHQKLYRTVTVHVLPVQSWGNPSVSSSGSNVGAEVTVTFTLPNGLPSSIFPLEIEFEDNQKNLNPLGTDMPAKVGSSIVPGQTNTSYQFVKSVSYLETETGAHDGYTDTKTLVCRFKRISTGPTRLYFKNQYFATQNNYVDIPQ